MLKSNKYVYPYTPFANLHNKEFTSKFLKPRTINLNELKSLVNKIQRRPEIKASGKNISEKIFSIFLSEEILFGPSEYLLQNKEGWIRSFDKYISRGEVLQLTILGFPFKIPVPLKTNRKMPDLGEVLSLTRLYHICELINSVYHPGAVITVFTEGVFGRFNGIDKAEYDAYKESLEILVEQLGYGKFIKIVELEKMENQVEDFEVVFSKKLEANKKKYASNDSDFMKKYNGAKESIYRIANTRDIHIAESVLMDVYNEDAMNVSNEVKSIREVIASSAHEMLLKYHSYLEVRDDLDYINKVVPDAITLSVSPKENRLGIIPVAKHCLRLPYHSVVVVNSDNSSFTLEYLIDIKRTGGKYTPVHLELDNDKAPFYYEEVV